MQTERPGIVTAWRGLSFAIPLLAARAQEWALTCWRLSMTASPKSSFKPTGREQQQQKIWTCMCQGRRWSYYIYAIRSSNVVISCLRVGKFSVAASKRLSSMKQVSHTRPTCFSLQFSSLMSLVQISIAEIHCTYNLLLQRIPQSKREHSQRCGGAALQFTVDPKTVDLEC